MFKPILHDRVFMLKVNLLNLWLKEGKVILKKWFQQINIKLPGCHNLGRVRFDEPKEVKS